MDDLKRRYYHIIEDKWNLPPTGRKSVGGHQQQFENRQDELRDLLNQAATQGCTGYNPDAWNWATRPVRLQPQSNNMSVQDTELANMWIKLNYLSRDERQRSSLFSAHKKMHALTRNDPEMAWSILKIMWNLDSSEKILANIAAGPLEDLLNYHGEQFIDRVEETAHSDPVFKKMLGAVWQNTIPDGVWNRVKAVAGPSF